MARMLADVTPLRRHRDFRRLWTGQLVSGFGSQLTIVGVAFQAYRLSRSTLVVGLVSLAQLGPLLVGSLWGGAIADSMDRRRLLLLAQGALATTSAGLVVNASLARPRLWPLFVCTAVAAAGQGIDWPTRRAAVAMLVPGQDLPAALALEQIVFQLAIVVGPAVAGLLISGVGLSLVFGLDVASFGFAFMAVALLPPLVPQRGSRGAGLASVGEGLRYLRGQRLLAATYVIDLDAMIFGMPRAVFPALAISVFGGGAGTLGLLYAAPGVGALAGALLTGWVGRVRHQARAVVVAVVVWGAAITGFGLARVVWIALGLLAVAGAADVVSAVFRGAIQQTTVPEHLQGRLSGTYIAVVTGGPRLGDAEAGAAAALGGPQFAVWSGGVACILGVGLLVWRCPELWRHVSQVRANRAAAGQAVTEAIAQIGEAGELP